MHLNGHAERQLLTTVRIQRQFAFARWAEVPEVRVNLERHQNMLRPGYRRVGVGAAASASEVRLTEVFLE